MSTILSPDTTIHIALRALVDRQSEVAANFVGPYPEGSCRDEWARDGRDAVFFRNARDLVESAEATLEGLRSGDVRVDQSVVPR